MSSIGRKAGADAGTDAQVGAEAASGGLVLPRALRKPFRHAMRLVNHGAWLSARSLALASCLIAGGAGAVWIGDSGAGDKLVALATARAGFRIAEIEVKGVNETSRVDVLTGIDLGVERSLFAFDVHAAREAAMKLPWVADARVSKSYPDRLLIEITERKPFALWQSRGEVRLIERSGKVITAFEERFAGLPLVVGEGAAAHAAEIVMAAARFPKVAERVVAFVRIGDRRWNLNLDNGLVVMLPEGPEAGQLAELDRMRAQENLFERDLVRVDMRLRDRLVLRLSPDAAERRREATGVKVKAEKDT